MTPDVKTALERAQMTAAMGNLTAKGNALLLSSVTATSAVEANSLHQEAVNYLERADEIRQEFATRFPNSLNLRQSEW